jgi:S-adenosylhomocysteine hydrolase
MSFAAQNKVDRLRNQSYGVDDPSDVPRAGVSPLSQEKSRPGSLGSLPRRWELTDEIPLRLPILDRWLANVAPAASLAGVTVLMIQHQLGNHVPQTQALIELGVSPEDIHWIDIPYTSTEAVREALYALGLSREHVAVSDFRALGRYRFFQRSRLLRFVRALLQDPPERLLVLDDGAHMLEALAGLKRRLPNVAIVEQTTRGLIKIEENAALDHRSQELCIINVARSEPKLTLEPPFIAVAVIDALKRKLGVAAEPQSGDQCLVLGYGAIGEQVAEFLSEQGFRRDCIYVSDPVEDRMRRASAVGFRLWHRERDPRFRLVVGCSGRSSFTVGDYVFLEDGAHLASASSGTVELSREDFIELADSNCYDDIWIEREGLDESCVHSDLRFHLVDREAIFLNGGFPVNFDGRVNCVPAHYIQPTPTMMCAAAVQAVSEARKGLVDLDPDFCRWLDTEFRAELGDEASLLSRSV